MQFLPYLLVLCFALSGCAYHATPSTHSFSDSVCKTVHYETAKTFSRTVYRTPTGKRYHFRSTCGGKNSYVITLETAIYSGLTPCKKCT